VAARRAIAADPTWQSQLYGVFVRAGRKAEADAWPSSAAGDEFPPLRYIHQGKMQQALAALDPQATPWRFAGMLLYNRDLDAIAAIKHSAGSSTNSASRTPTRERRRGGRHITQLTQLLEPITPRPRKRAETNGEEHR
jgi:hypothetical protein